MDIKNINDIINSIYIRIINNKDKYKKYKDNYISLQFSINDELNQINESLIEDNFYFELSCSNVIVYIFVEFINYNYMMNYDYKEILKKFDCSNIYSWYKLPPKYIVELKNEIFSGDFKFNIDVLIKLYQELLNNIEKKRLGQFYTPKIIVNYMLRELSLNRISIHKNVKIIDPACGAGVFLCEYINLLIKRKKENLINYIYNNIYGNDINPFAIILCKLNITQVLLFSLTSNYEINDFLEKYIDLPNIRIRNTITTNDNNKYDYIIGNPPYNKIRNKKFNNCEFYKEIMFGQQNLYSIFIYWAIKYIKKSGKISMIVPQSFRTGYYFKELRKQLFNTSILSLIDIKSRNKIFDNVEQAVIIITLKNVISNKSMTKIVHMEDLDSKIDHSYKIDQRQLNIGVKYDNFFIIPSSFKMFNIIEKVYANSINLNEMNHYIFGNGLFVWNQNKEYLRINDENRNIPVIYCTSIKEFEFNFINHNNHKTRKKGYCQNNSSIKKFKLSGKRLIVQRTSTIERFQRIKSCIINDEFLMQYQEYLLENHINMLYIKNNKQQLIKDNEMYHLMALLNSKLINYIFGSKNCNTQVSARELNLLPISFENKEIITSLSRRVTNLNDIALINEMNDVIYRAYDLSREEIRSIENEMH